MSTTSNGTMERVGGGGTINGYGALVVGDFVAVERDGAEVARSRIEGLGRFVAAPRPEARLGAVPGRCRGHLPLRGGLRRHPPTAVFAASDDLALGALERLRALGRRVPEGLAIVGFDGIPLAQEVTPSLTTIRVPFDKIGRRAAELLLGGAHRAPEATTITLPVELIQARSA
jgi:DNA-binding LacI/PurR family transcriptional regulator